MNSSAYGAPRGVPLGSLETENAELRARQQELVDREEFTDWRMFYWVALFFCLLLVFLDFALDVGEPYQPTEYVPYVAPVKGGANAKKES